MYLGEAMPRPAQIDAAGYRVIMRVLVVGVGDARQPDAECLAALLTPVGVEQDVAGNPEHPCPGIINALRDVVDTTPHNDEHLGGNVLSQTGVRASLHEPENIGVHRFVQRPFTGR
jgi:hypothetical protein